VKITIIRSKCIEINFRQIVSSLYLCIYLSICFYMLFHDPDIKRKITMFLVLMGAGSYFFTKNKIMINISVFFIIIYFVIALNIIGLFNYYNSAAYTSMCLSNFCLALFLFKNKHNASVYYFLIIIFSIVFFVQIFSFSDPDLMFAATSRNMISVIMLTGSLVYYITSCKNNEKISFVPALLTLLISIWAVGRSGILCSFFLLIGVIYVQTRKFTFKRKFTLFMLVNTILIAVFIIFNNDIMYFIDSMTLFERFLERGVDDSERSLMIREYMSHIDLKSLLVGYDYTQDGFFISSDLNPHNSFIRLHHYMGIFGIIFMFVMSFLILFYIFINPLYSVLLSTLLIRGFTDIIIFFTVYDFIVFYFIIDFAYKYKTEYKKYFMIIPKRRLTSSC